ncbi:hypothetical protein V1633_25790 [Plantactinospora sonchi]|uniref:WD40 repeat domain-containing protein n=1 Tax=Plantactinospora sonchi TaxID=1544735 RepID=A0ABU7RZK0_9ACTN
MTGLVSYSDDRTGRPRVLVTSYAGTRVVLDLADGRLIGAPDDRPYASVSVTTRIAGERMIVSAGGTGHLQVSDLASGRLRWRRWCGEARALATVALDGRPVAVLAGGASQLQVWTLTAERGERLATVRTDGGRIAALAATEWDDDGLVALGGTTGQITLWRLAVDGAGARVERLGECRFEEPRLVSALRFATWQGRSVLLGAAGRLARVWAVPGGPPLGPSFAGHLDTVNSVEVGRLDGRPVIWSSDAVTVRGWLPETGRQLGEAYHHPYEAALTSMTVVEIADRSTLVCGDTAGRVWTWEPERPYPLRRGAAATTSEPDVPPSGVGPVRLATVEFAGRPVVLAGLPDRAVRGLDPVDGSTVDVPVDGLWDVPLLVPGDRPVLAQTGPDGIAVWDPATGERLGTALSCPDGVLGPDGPLGPLASTLLDGAWMLLLTAGERLFRIDVATGTVVGPLVGHSGPIHAVVSTELAGVPVLLTAAGDDTVVLWDPRANRSLGVVLSGHGGAAYAVTAATVDGRALVYGAGRSGVVRGVDVTDLLEAERVATTRVGPEPGGPPVRTGVPEPVVVLTATGPVRALAVVRSGQDSWLVAADGRTLLWCPVTDEFLPRWTTDLDDVVDDLVALPQVLVAATGEGLVGYRPGAPHGPAAG